MNDTHHYAAKITWHGKREGSPLDYRSYDRTHLIEIAGKPPLTASADPAFLGDSSFYNPEDMLVAALSSCHMLSYLAICARARITVLSYTDKAEGVMIMDQPDTGRFSDVLLKPVVELAPGSDVEKARSFHAMAHKVCFIARSVNFPVRHEPRFV